MTDINSIDDIPRRSGMSEETPLRRAGADLVDPPEENDDESLRRRPRSPSRAKAAG